MKQGLIEARVTRFGNISEKIKEFIHDKSAHNYTPFYKDEEVPNTTKLQNRAKRSLTDWRQLYTKKTNKIIPGNSLYPTTPDAERKRCSVTGQCNRTRNNFSTAKMQSIQGDVNYAASECGKQDPMNSKRQSLIQYAFVQHCYENDLLKEDRVQTSKGRRFYQKRSFDSRRGELSKVGNFLSKLSIDRSQLREINATQKYITQINDFDRVKMQPYNNIKIKVQKFKIDNTRFFQGRRGLLSQNGLRFYERA